MSARHRGPRPPPPPPSSPLTVTSHNPERRGGGECPAPRSPPALHPIVFPPQCTPTHSSPPLLPLPPEVRPACPRPPPLTHTHTRVSWGRGRGVCRYSKADTPSFQPQLSPHHPRSTLPVLDLTFTPFPKSPVPLWSSGDKLLRQCLIHRQLNQLRALRGGRRTNRLPPTLPPTHTHTPEGGRLEGRERRSAWTAA